MNKPEARIRRRPAAKPDPQINTARWAPVVVALFIAVARLVFPGAKVALAFLLLGGALAWSGWQWQTRGVGLRFLLYLQIAGGFAAVAIGVGDIADPARWLHPYGWMMVMFGYTCYVFNLIATFLPP